MLFCTTSSQDADSLDPESGEKGEGYFYVWKASEIEDILGDKAAAFMEHYYVKPGGNCDLSSRSDPHKEFVGKNCLIAMQSIAETASDMKLSESEASQLIGQCRKLLHEKRATRPRPGLDDKVKQALQIHSSAQLYSQTALSTEQQQDLLTEIY